MQDEHTVTLMGRITDRAEQFFSRSNEPFDRIDFLVILSQVHQTHHLCLSRLLNTTEGEFARDVRGMLQHWNPIDLKLDNGFLPRCVAPAWVNELAERVPEAHRERVRAAITCMTRPHAETYVRKTVEILTRKRA